jgi:hypothetical protein
MTHWHNFNPWADHIVYLPDLKELSACLDPYDPERQLNRWLRERGEKLDAYILPQPSGWHDCGVRYGEEGSEYYSPHIDRYIADLLLNKYRSVK